MAPRVLVTGGTGFLALHTVLALLKKGFLVTITDDFETEAAEKVINMETLAGDSSGNLTKHPVDMTREESVEEVFKGCTFDAVIHMAGLTGVRESVQDPLTHFHKNLNGGVSLMKIMAKYNCKKLVFTSSASVYGEVGDGPCFENMELKPLSPYGYTKKYLEEIAVAAQKADKDWRILLLRCFTPAGAHDSGLIGQEANESPNSLMVRMTEVVTGGSKELAIHGYAYATPDRTAVRDYVHVLDVAAGHVAALEKVLETKDIGCDAINLGTGIDTSVLGMVNAFEEATGKHISYKFHDGMDGDASSLYASTLKAEKELGWKAQYDIKDICRDHWRFAKK